MKKLFNFLIDAVIVVAIVFLGMKYINKCDSCEKIYLGLGYQPGFISELVNSDMEAVCKDCAEEQHAVQIALGKDIEEYKIK